MRTAKYYKDKLSLITHPEGGAFREVYRSDDMIGNDSLSKNFEGGVRNICTSIYFLLESTEFSAFHKIKSDEIWNFYDGDPLEIFEIVDNGKLIITTIGRDVEENQLFQYTVTKGRWFASRVKAGGEFSLVGCTVSPGFDFLDFTLAQSEELKKKYPHLSDLISSLTV